MDEKNELQLSRDLNVITAEINSYKQVAGQAIFEIGRRLKHVKEHDLVHGEWDKWCNEELGFSRRYANQYIKVAEEFGENGKTYSQLGVNALYHIATLPQEEREKEHVTSKGETKTVDEMTVRELQEVKRKNRDLEQAKQQAESQAEQYKKSEKIARDLLEKEQNKEPKVVEKEIYKEIDNTDYDKVNNLESEMRRIRRELDEKTSELGEVKSNYKELDDLKDVLNKLHRERDDLLNSMDIAKVVGETKSEIEECSNAISILNQEKFLGDIKSNGFLRDALKKELYSLMDNASDFIEKIDSNNNIIDAEIIN